MTRIKNLKKSVPSVPSVSPYFSRTRIQWILRIRRKNLRLSAFIRVLFCLSLTTAVSAQTHITLTADRETLTVGDPIEINIAVTHPPGTTAQLTATDWGAFELLAGPDAAPRHPSP